MKGLRNECCVRQLIVLSRGMREFQCFFAFYLLVLFAVVSSFLIGLQITKARVLCCKHELCLADQCWAVPVEFVAQ